VKYLIVRGLELACVLTHPLQRLPVTGNYARCWFAAWSCDLDERWDTGAWAP
jgi:hypothetical protein